MNWLAVALGGSLGAVARYALATSLASHSAKFPVATLLANVIGSLLMACFYVLIVEKLMLPAVLRQLIMVGFLGAFTTFSTFSLDAILLVQRGQHLLAAAYIGASVAACLLAVVVGFQLTHALLRA